MSVTGHRRSRNKKFELLISGPHISTHIVKPVLSQELERWPYNIFIMPNWEQIENEEDVGAKGVCAIMVW